MLSKIEQWIDHTLNCYKNERVSCARFTNNFNGFFSSDFLSKSYYVITENLPKPDFPELRELGLSEILDMDPDGITYKNTYFIKLKSENSLRLHFHELVHVAQWQLLGAVEFINRYINEIGASTYANSSLEIMAYTLDAHFSNGGKLFDIPTYVQQNI